jgi:hypothetical protein
MEDEGSFQVEGELLEALVQQFPALTDLTIDEAVGQASSASLLGSPSTQHFSSLAVSF